MAHSFISVEKFAAEPHSGIVGYPRATSRQMGSRIAELGRLGISSIALTGPTSIGSLSVLGKGYVGVVVLARRKNKSVALKIRRTDSPRKSMAGESALLGRANSVGVGPKVIDHSRNFLVMEYLPGAKFPDWVASLGGPGSAKRLRSAIRDVLSDCHRLDLLGLDHGELSNISKHVIVGEGGASLIDFESASTERRASNVTSVAQAFFVGTAVSRGVRRICKVPPKEEAIAALREYKHDRSEEGFGRLLGALGLA